MKRLFGLLLALVLVCVAAYMIVKPAEARVKKPVHKKHYLKKKPARKVPRRAAKLRAPTGLISQRYSIEEGLDEDEADNLAAEMKSLGVKASSVNLEKNTMMVKFDPAKVSAVKILSKLKTLGYTVKRID